MATIPTPALYITVSTPIPLVALLPVPYQTVIPTAILMAQQAVGQIIIPTILVGVLVTIQVQATIQPH